MLSDEVSRVERAKKTASLCEMMASAIRRDVYAMSRLMSARGVSIGKRMIASTKRYSRMVNK